MNAVAHAVEALYSRSGHPLVRLEADEALRILLGKFPVVVVSPRDIPARSDALYGAMLAGRCLAATEMAMQHRLSHLLGGMLLLPHAETHAVLLPYVVAYNSPAVGSVFAKLAGDLRTDDLAGCSSLHRGARPAVLVVRAGWPTTTSRKLRARSSRQVDGTRDRSRRTRCGRCSRAVWSGAAAPSPAHGVPLPGELLARQAQPRQRPAPARAPGSARRGTGTGTGTGQAASSAPSARRVRSGLEGGEDPGSCPLDALAGTPDAGRARLRARPPRTRT